MLFTNLFPIKYSQHSSKKDKEISLNSYGTREVPRESKQITHIQ